MEAGKLNGGKAGEKGKAGRPRGSYVDAKEVLRLRESGLTVREVAKQLNTSKSTVERVSRDSGQMFKVLRQCAGCGDDFEPANNRQRNCSRKCRVKVVPEPLPMRACEFCGELYAPTIRRQSFCGKKCADKDHYQRKYDPMPESLICQECGGEFKPKRRDQKFCTPTCRSRKNQRDVDQRADPAEAVNVTSEAEPFWPRHVRDLRLRSGGQITVTLTGDFNLLTLPKEDRDLITILAWNLERYEAKG